MLRCTARQGVCQTAFVAGLTVCEAFSRKAGRRAWEPRRRRTTVATADGASTPREIVLLSGGLDSGVLLHHVHAQHGSATLPLIVDYGQRGRAREAAAADALCAGLGLTDVVRLDLSGVGRALRARSKERRHVPVVHRNGVLLALAASVGGQEGARGLWVAVSADDAGWYASAGRDYLDKSDMAIRALGGGMRLQTPWLSWGKERVVREGARLGVPFAQTWSCMLDYERHCGRCVQCRARKEAMRRAGVAEEEGFYLR